MNTFKLITKEIVHRRFNFLFSLLAVITAVALFVFFMTTGKASQRETARLMRDIGYNLRIVSKETDMDAFWAVGFSDQFMPEEWVRRFTEQKGFSYTHLLAMLQKEITWEGMEVLLMGLAPEVSPPDKKKSPMIFSIEPGTVHAGFELARALALKKGDQVELMGRSFLVAGCLSESGSRDDATLYGNLGDVQELLGMEGRINEIKALECLCRDPGKDSITLLREQLAMLLPDARVIQIKSIAAAREKQRLMMEKQFAQAAPFVLVVCAVWIGILAMVNVRDRQREVGILRALGYGSKKIAALFLGRAGFIGLAGAALGFGIGTLFALTLGPQVFQVTAKGIKPDFALLYFSLIAAPVFSAVSSLIPAASAVAQDPAVSLREE